MFKNYFKTAFRNLWKNKTYGFLNIFGLATGIACAALIFLWVEDELTFNDSFPKKDYLYSVKNNQTYDGTTYTFDATPGVLAPTMKSEIPGIKNTARCTWGNKLLFSLGDKSIYEQGNYVDSNLFSMLQLHFIKGNASDAFAQLHSVVISKKMADKFFGSTDVIGKTLKVNNEHEYVVTGVIKDLPENVSFKFDWLAPFKIYEDQNTWLQKWGNNGIVTYVEVQPSTNLEAVNARLHGYIQSKDAEANSRLFIFPMRKWRLYNNFVNGIEDGGRIKYVNLFSIIAWIILIIACINFMNLATARSEKRAREVGVRKVMGAGKGMLMSQFIGEALIMSFLSALLAIAIVAFALPGFNGLVDKELSLNLQNPLHLAGLFAIAFICGIIAGSYPAFYLSSFNPVVVLKGLKIKTNASAGFIRKGLVVVQFSISIILIIGTIIIYKQINHIKDRQLGYDKEGLVYMNLQGKMKEHFNSIKNDLISTGAVQNVGLSNDYVLQLGSNTGDFAWQGKDPNKQILITVEGVSPEYISTLGMKLKAGRDFYADIAADSNNIIINESLAKLIGKKDLVGSLITRDGGNQKYTIVGIIDDFVYNDMYSSSAPLILFPDTANVNFLNIRFKAKTDLAGALAKVENVIKTHEPGYPFEYKFVDEQFHKLFKTETLIGKLSWVFSALAIIISCLGLFGLAAYTAERRTKEIGIRKVLGATTGALAGLLSKDFLQLVGISCLVAFPVAWWAMHNWLQTYPYRIEISWWTFGLSGLLAIFIALLTISFQAVKAAVANPVKSLRSE
ncbi:ABC transporter permease [Segetibacter koreensis]|uniref:ABC transporter permease n=1 Tax=Segetibacter koreensis TaxID=398037 RepID=UPI000372CBE2|nr:ABC transporter permease [Segetibacter koreensis]